MRFLAILGFLACVMVSACTQPNGSTTTQTPSVHRYVVDALSDSIFSKDPTKLVAMNSGFNSITIGDTAVYIAQLDGGSGFSDYGQVRFRIGARQLFTGSVIRWAKSSSNAVFSFGALKQTGSGLWDVTNDDFVATSDGKGLGNLASVNGSMTIDEYTAPQGSTHGRLRGRYTIFVSNATVYEQKQTNAQEGKRIVSQASGSFELNVRRP